MSKAIKEVPAKVVPAPGPSPEEEAEVYEAEPCGPRRPHQHFSEALLPSLGNEALEKVGQPPGPSPTPTPGSPPLDSKSHLSQDPLVLHLDVKEDPGVSMGKMGWKEQCSLVNQGGIGLPQLCTQRTQNSPDPEDRDL